MSYITNQWVKMNPFEAAARLNELERENAALRADKERLLEASEFAVRAMEMHKSFSSLTIKYVRAAIDAARKEQP